MFRLGSKPKPLRVCGSLLGNTEKKSLEMKCVNKSERRCLAVLMGPMISTTLQKTPTMVEASSYNAVIFSQSVLEHLLFRRSFFHHEFG